jgi:hypothetical protein
VSNLFLDDNLVVFQEVGSAASVEGARVVPLLLGIMVMMAFFGILI